MKRKRRYREKFPHISIAGSHGHGRIHDFFKGWGTVCKDGSILWDTWRPATKREFERYKRRSEKNKGKIPTILFPLVKAVMPTLTAEDIIGVQPMMTKY
jgi:hypothetical protein